jgi:protein AaeX
VIGEFDVYGVYLPAFAVFAAIALVIQLAIKRLLDASGLYRFVWHRALFDVAIYVIVLAVVTAAAESILQSFAGIGGKSVMQR